MPLQQEQTTLFAKTRQQIADEYFIHPKTLNRWLIRHEIVLPKGNLAPLYQKMIYETFGYPISVCKTTYDMV